MENYGKSPFLMGKLWKTMENHLFLMGKLTISMAIMFNSYVRLPKGFMGSQ